MSELKALEELGKVLDPPAASPPDRLRQRVMEQAARPPVHTRSPRFTVPRLALAGGMATVLTAGVLVAQVLDFGDHRPASSAQAVVVLHAAASQAKNRPSLTVRGDQFIYVESIATTMSRNEATAATTLEASQRRSWRSVDGERDGVVQLRPKSGTDEWRTIVIPGCHDGTTTQTKGDRVVHEPCKPLAGYQNDLPTSADDMLAYLYQGSGRTKNPRDQDAFTKAQALIGESYLRPASLAAVFEAVARIPGVTVVGNVTDEAGRTGVAVAINEVQGIRTELIFDRRTNGYLGARSVVVQGKDGLKAGQVTDSMAVLTVAVVDKVGQLP